MAENKADLLTPKQRRAINALMESRTTREAAKIAAIGERTLYRWLSEPIFRQALQEAENQAAYTTARGLNTGTGQALDVLAGILAGDEISDAVKLQAAKAWIDYFLKTRDYANLDARITALEMGQYCGK